MQRTRKVKAILKKMSEISDSEKIHQIFGTNHVIQTVTNNMKTSMSKECANHSQFFSILCCITKSVNVEDEGYYIYGVKEMKTVGGHILKLPGFSCSDAQQTCPPQYKNIVIKSA